MAGSPTCGKISIGMRSTARTAQSAIAIRATITVIGLLSAARTRRMIPASWRHSLACLGQEGPDVAARGSHAEQSPPGSQQRQRIVYFGLREEPLRFRHVVD